VRFNGGDRFGSASELARLCRDVVAVGIGHAGNGEFHSLAAPKIAAVKDETVRSTQLQYSALPQHNKDALPDSYQSSNKAA
jgi:hypothetical protein